MNVGFFSVLILYLGVYLPSTKSQSFPDRHFPKSIPVEKTLAVAVEPIQHSAEPIFRTPTDESLSGVEYIVRKKGKEFAPLPREKRELNLMGNLKDNLTNLKNRAAKTATDGLFATKNAMGGVANRLSSFAQLGKRRKRSGDVYDSATAISEIQEAFQKFIKNSATYLQNSFQTFATNVINIEQEHYLKELFEVFYIFQYKNSSPKRMIRDVRDNNIPKGDLRETVSSIMETCIDKLQVHLENMSNVVDRMKKELVIAKQFTLNILRGRKLDLSQTLNKTAIGDKASEDDTRLPSYRSRRSPDDTVVDDRNIVGMKSFRQDLNDAQIGDGLDKSREVKAQEYAEAPPAASAAPAAAAYPG